MATKYYYADASGDDSGSSEANAYTDFETALEGIAAGDILYCKKSASRPDFGPIGVDMAAQSDTATTIVEGYDSTPGDGVRWQGDGRLDLNSGGNIIFKNLDIESSRNGYIVEVNSNNTYWYNCKFYQTRTVAAEEAVRVNFHSHFVNCYFDTDSAASTSRGTVYIATSDGGSFYGCVFRGDRGIYTDQLATYALNVQNCIFTDGSTVPMAIGIDADLINSSAEPVFFNVSECTFYGFGTDGIALRDLPDPSGNPKLLSMIQNNIFYGSSATNAINIEDASHNTGVMVVGNAYGGVTNQTNGGGTNFPNLDAVTLSSDPFIDGANLDFRLNDTSDGGALCKGTAYPTSFIGITGDVERNIGSFQYTKESITIF
jgi:hypothetical protein